MWVAVPRDGGEKGEEEQEGGRKLEACREEEFTSKPSVTLC